MDVDPKKLRAWGRLLSTLLQTPEDELDDFLRERLDGAALEERSLAKAQALLVQLGRAFDDPVPERWRGIEHAADTVETWERGRTDEAAAVTANPGSAPPTTPDPSSQPSPWAKGGAGPPIQGAPAAPPSPVPSPPPPAPSPPPPAPAPLLRPASALMATAPVSDDAPQAEPLPFRKDAGSEVPAPVAERLAPSAELGATVARTGGKGPTLPFAAVADERSALANEPPPGMTLGKYAQLCVERNLWPDNTAGRRARFGIDEAGEAQADAYFKRRFDRDAAQRATWLALCEVHKNKIAGPRMAGRIHHSSD